MNQDELRRAGQRLTGWQRTMLLAHVRPDGDALGALATMRSVIEAQGREATVFMSGDVATRYQFLCGVQGCEIWDEQTGADPAALDARFDGILIMDTCSWSQLEPVADYLRASGLPKLIVDHHATRDELTGQGGDDMYVIDTSASSACLMLCEWIEAMGWPLDGEAREALFTGISTDTGWFRFPNTDPRTLRAAAALLEGGVRPDVLYTRLYASLPVAKLRLRGAMLDTLEIHADGALAVAVLTPAMFESSKASAADAEDLVNELMTADDVVVALLFTEMDDGQVRVNFRSNSPEVAGFGVDVAALAKTIGGGGHERAAGARVEGALDEVRANVTRTAAEAIARERGSGL